MRKIVWLLKRARGEGVEAFQASLLHLRGMDPPFEGLEAYVQSHSLLKGYAKGELLFDAVEEFAFPSAAAAAAFRGSEANDIAWRRRLPIIDHTQSHIFEVDVHRVKDTPVSPGAVKNIEFVTRRPDMELRAFRRYWLENHGPLGARIPTIQRYEQNHTVPEAYDGKALPRFDGLAITWFASTQAMRDGANTPVYAETRADEANFLPDGHLPIIITREVLGAAAEPGKEPLA